MNRLLTLPKKILILSAVLMDAMLLTASDILSFLIRFGGSIPRDNFSAYLQIYPWILAFRLCCFYIFELYSRPKYRANYDTIYNVVKATSVSSLIIAATAFFTHTFEYSRTLIPLSWAFTSFFIIAWRILVKRLITFSLGSNYFVSRILIIGTDRNAHRLTLSITRDAAVQRRLVGYLKTNDSVPSWVDPSLILGDLESLPRLMESTPIDEVVIASTELPRERVAEIFTCFLGTDVIVRAVPDLYEAVIGKVSGVASQEIPLVELTSGVRGRGWYVGMKRILDVVIALVALIVTLPLSLLIVVAIKLTSPGKALFLQERVGMHGRLFTMYKFRSMFRGSEDLSGPVWAGENDPRITPVGRILRATRLDELPQFLNVLRNEMSVVGPRPERSHFVKHLMDDIPFYVERLAVKPGITGWAQVTFRYASTIEDHREKLLHDIFYIENMTLALDFLILLKTVGVVLKGRGAH